MVKLYTYSSLLFYSTFHFGLGFFHAYYSTFPVCILSKNQNEKTKGAARLQSLQVRAVEQTLELKQVLHFFEQNVTHLAQIQQHSHWYAHQSRSTNQLSVTDGR